MKTLKLKNGRAWLTILNANDDGFGAGPDYDAEMTIRGQIGEDWYGNEGYTEKQFADEIKPLAGKRVLLNIHSQGGNIWDAFAIHGMVKAHGKVDTKILGIAASSADLIFQAGANRIMPKLAMRMGHNPMGAFYASGNATQLKAQAGELQKTIDRLEKHTDMLVGMYADRSGNTKDDCRTMMDAEEFMGGEESKNKGFCDMLTDEDPDQDRLDLTPFKKASGSKAILNFFNTGPKPGNTQPKDNTVKREQKIALLNSWGVKVADNVTDDWLDAEIAKGKPQPGFDRAAVLNILKGWGVQVQDSATDAELKTKLEAGKPAAAVQPPANVVDMNSNPEFKRMKAQLDEQRRKSIRATLDTYAGEGRIPAAQIQAWEDEAFNAVDTDKGNPVLNRLGQLEPKAPGLTPVVDIKSDGTIDKADLLRACGQLMAPRNAMLQLRASPKDKRLREDLSQNSIQMSRMVRQQVDRVCNNIPEQDTTRRAQVIAGWLDSMPIMNDTQTSYGAAGAPGVSISSDLQRQVIFSESMRAFRRRLVALDVFAHTWNSVPLEGKDEIDVPYYPLFTSTSSRYTASGGYKFQNTDQELRKQITVGGSGPDTKVAGQDRAYQAMTWSAYMLRRQPWADIIKLAVMRTEQLAVDVLNDIITAWVLKANFGNAVWSGLPGAFDETDVALIAGACEKLDWPETGKNLVLGTDYYVNLASSPYVKAFLNIGDTGTIRQNKIGGLYGFDETISNPRLPVTSDGNLIGFAAYPSSVLVATSPILPAPGEMKLMVSYDLVTDDQTGLTFEYKYWGEPWNSADREIIECNYGSGLGEKAALLRLVATGS